MKTAELLPPLLDEWVARALGCEPGAAYSSDWSHGGPVIERGKIGVEYGPHNMLPDAKWNPELGPWHGYVQRQDGGRSFAFGPTPLIAAMRAKVASVYGDEVPDEEKP